MDHDELDPADADALDDRTTAAAAASSSAVVDLPTTRGRLRLRSAVPVAEGYQGTAVSRNDYFETKDDEADDEKYQLLEQQLDDQLDMQMASGLSISGDVEEEYNKLMRETQQELSVMRQPSAEDVAQKRADAQQLKQQIGMWAALVETRIHLEAWSVVYPQIQGAVWKRDPVVSESMSFHIDRSLRGALFDCDMSSIAGDLKRIFPKSLPFLVTSGAAVSWTSASFGFGGRALPPRCTGG